MQESLALKLRVLRAERALTIEQAAERAGVRPETISDAERGRRHPYVPTLRKLAKAYGVKVEDLLSQEKLEPATTADRQKVEAPQERAKKTALEHILEASGSATKYLVDDTLPERIEDMDAGEALAVGPAVARELEIVLPELLHRYLELGASTDRVAAHRDLTDARLRGIAVRLALQAKFSEDPEPVPRAAAAVEDIRRVLETAK